MNNRGNLHVAAYLNSTIAFSTREKRSDSILTEAIISTAFEAVIFVHSSSALHGNWPESSTQAGSTHCDTIEVSACFRGKM